MEQKDFGYKIIPVSRNNSLLVFISWPLINIKKIYVSFFRFNPVTLNILYPPDSQVVATGGQEVRVHPLGVGNPHDLGGGVRVVKSVPADEL